MITPQIKAQIDYAAETNAAVRELIGELGAALARLHVLESDGAASMLVEVEADLVACEAELAAAQLEIQRLTTLALTWREEVLSREEIVRIALDERDEAITAFAQAGAV